MAQVNIWPALGLTVYAESGVQIPNTGLTVTVSDYYQRLLRGGEILTYDPLDQGAPTTTETVTSSETSPLYCTDLGLLVGSFDRAVISVDGYAASLDGGGGQFIWVQGSSTTANNGTIFGTTSSGRWKRIYSGAVNVKWFGAKGDASANDSLAIQNAISTGASVEFPSGEYKCGGLTQSTASQELFCRGGIALLHKNANGTILASSGNDVQLRNIRFYGAHPVYSGGNVTFSGIHAQMLNCASDSCTGRAVIMTGDSSSILGTCATYTTSDTSATGYDIEMGTASGVTLYHTISNIRTSQSYGGIKLVRTGGVSISDSTFGKLWFDSSGAGTGSGAGRVSSCRILGNILVEQSNGVFFGNQFSAITITLGVGTGNSVFDVSNNFSAVTSIVNNGNANNLIMSETSAGSSNKIKFGGTSSTAILDIDPTGVIRLPGTTYIKNNTTLGLRNAADSGDAIAMFANASDNAFIAHTGGTYMAISSTGVLQLVGTNGIDISSGLTTPLYRKSNIGLTASTTQTQAAGIALGLTGDIIHIETCANANDTIALPPAVAGRDCTVINKGANTLKIYPYTSDNLGAGVNTSTTLASGSTVRYLAVDATNWVTV